VAPTVVPTTTPTAVVVPTATPPLATRPPATPPPATPTPRPQAVNLKTFHTNLSFETYETEETISLELGQLPGVASVSVTQLDVTVQYDPTRLSEEEILRTLRNNPEVRIRDDHPGQ
jgi:hypothetical protein